jgi:hypothetical protein
MVQNRIHKNRIMRIDDNVFLYGKDTFLLF